MKKYPLYFVLVIRPKMNIQSGFLTILDTRIPVPIEMGFDSSLNERNQLS